MTRSNAFRRWLGLELFGLALCLSWVAGIALGRDEDGFDEETWDEDSFDEEGWDEDGFEAAVG